MEAMFEIFDSDNDGYFGLDDLITLLRSYEKLQIVPQLKNFCPQRNVSNSSGSKTDVSDSASSESAHTAVSSGEVPDIVLDEPFYYSSKEIKKVASKMLKSSGFNNRSMLTLSDFTVFMNENT